MCVSLFTEIYVVSFLNDSQGYNWCFTSLTNEIKRLKILILHVLVNT